MKPDQVINQKIMDRIEDGNATPDQVLFCDGCGARVFDLTVEEIKLQMEGLVTEGKVERRPQGKATDSPGSPIEIYVPAGTGVYRSSRTRGDEMVSGKGEATDRGNW